MKTLDRGLDRSLPPPAAVGDTCGLYADLIDRQSVSPAFRSPFKYVASNKALIFGAPKGPMVFRRAMLEYRSSAHSLRASSSSAAARSPEPLRAWAEAR